ncbi:MAG: hypothetical protein J7623_09115 [Chitinophaga sp.]|uniref:hypothetical protein n=1 Tax=Chitinophaga sp. TaxID=1869181 RepID=UPI001B19946D|nr:hypothetical protein [Chitinophaga sp.]MBO9728785.1 hypothetical protein [Chitinophaga sp.]
MKHTPLYLMGFVLLTFIVFGCRKQMQLEPLDKSLNASVAKKDSTHPGDTIPHDTIHHPGDTIPHHPGDTIPHHPGDTIPHHPGDTIPHHPGDTIPHHPGDTIPHNPDSTWRRR